MKATHNAWPVWADFFYQPVPELANGDVPEPHNVGKSSIYRTFQPP
jgi:hypothetical protein